MVPADSKPFRNTNERFQDSKAEIWSKCFTENPKLIYIYFANLEYTINIKTKFQAGF